MKILVTQWIMKSIPRHPVKWHAVPKLRKTCILEMEMMILSVLLIGKVSPSILLNQINIDARFTNKPSSNLLKSYNMLQQKFFDSGDYQMAKQRPSNLAAPFKAPAAPAKLPTGDAIPTPETVPLRKTSIIQPKFQAPSQTS